jgi:hypothetical protein
MDPFATMLPVTAGEAVHGRPDRRRDARLRESCLHSRPPLIPRPEKALVLFGPAHIFSEKRMYCTSSDLAEVTQLRASEKRFCERLGICLALARSEVAKSKCSENLPSGQVFFGG